MSTAQTQQQPSQQTNADGDANSGISNSRFSMWRAVFALAHKDGRIDEKEIAYIDNYLACVPFSAQQKQIIHDDLITPQSINGLLIGVSDPADMSDFFQFAQMMIVADGEISEQEEAIINRLTAEQVNRFNRQEICAQIRQTRAAATLRRAVEDEEYRRQAKNTGVAAHLRRMMKDREYASKSGTIMKHTLRELPARMGYLLGNMLRLDFGVLSREDAPTENEELRSVMRWMQERTFTAPEPEIFSLWRAIFALVHADDHLSPFEEEYVHGMMAIFHFDDAQRAQIDTDLQQRPNASSLFDEVNPAYHRTYFALAHTILWCDGQLHEKEVALIEELATRCAPDQTDISWLAQPPALPGDTPETPHQRESATMKAIMREMYKFQQQI